MPTKSTHKIGFVLDDGLDTEDGVQQYILTLGGWLEKQGHTVHYLVGQTTRTDIQNVHSLARNVRVSFNGNKLTIPLPASRPPIQQVLANEKFDVLHVQVPYSPFFGAKVVRMAPKSTKIIGTFHILPYGIVSVLGTKLLGLVLRRNLKKFGNMLAVSSSAQSFAKNTFRVSSEVVPNMVDVRKYMPPKTFKRNNSKVKIVFVGRLVERKGCGYLIDALGKVHANNPKLQFELVICGKGPLQDKLRLLSHDVGISPHVTFAGFVSEDEKIRQLQEADIAVFPAYGGESFGIVLIEAIAAKSGCVLAGKNPGYGSVFSEIPDALVDVKNISEFEAKLKNLISDPEARTEIYDAQQKIIHKFDVNTVGTQVLQAYENCKKP